MREIEYTIGDATDPSEPGNKVIVHVCNDAGGWGAGFVLALSRKWPEPEFAYRSWHRLRNSVTPPPVVPFELGEVDFVKVEPDIWVANMVGQVGYGTQNGPPIRYWALEKGLEKVWDFALKNAATVHMPRIGCGLAGGEWSAVESLIRGELSSKDVAVTVYDLPPRL